MFNIVPSPTFEGAVAITVPGADSPATLRVTWRHKGRKALSAWLRATATIVPAATAPVLPGQAQSPGDAAWLGEVITAWAGPVDEAGAAAPYSEAALAALLDAYPAAGAELLAAYLSAMTESRAKN